MEHFSRKSRNKPKPKSKSKGKSRSGGPTRTGDSGKTGPDSSLVIFRMAGSRNQVIRRTFRTVGVITSTAGGAIALVSSSASGLIATLAAEWTNFAQEFQDFRCRGMKFHFLPSLTTATNITGPYLDGIQVAPWQQFPIATAATIQQGDKYVAFSSVESRTIVVIPRGPNFALWTPYGTTLAADRDFGLAYVSLGGGLPATSRVFTLVAEMDAEFHIPQ